ncbi:hypothetical protein BGW36DRAFT_298792 [Talaromyces proteolyticus]|uniref:DUF1765-domain-containing protein n=1 Tax=Talaromyces proteolyticus TaxID=1131652 RepID=A0AAD4KLR0_9EURO|nr:uncharacterized protein BGW36DRAFT_298792 [Talaromyces proteolyticus]KAH8694920.1 hypothetical protein BGW36DRAFT_298792 [Talaromyces proteolyticus]
MALHSGPVEVQQRPFQPQPLSTQSSTEPIPRPLFHRAASFDSTKEDESDHGPSSPGVKRTFSDLSLSSKNDSSFKENLSAGKEILRRVTLRSPNKPKPAATRSSPSKTTVASSSNGNTLKEKSTNVGTANSMETNGGESRQTIPVRPTKARSVSGKIATLARVSWMAGSRSPSPGSTESKRRASRSREQSPTPGSHLRDADGVSLQSGTSDDKGASVDSAESPRRSINKKTRRPLSAFVPRSKSADPSASSSPSLRSRKSLDEMMRQHISTATLPPLPKAPVISVPVTVEPPRKKDELWTVFRVLEADLHRFQAKSTNLKANVIRSSLLPFLARYASHPSLDSLRPEDLDRRVNIWNKWWTALLAMLHGNHHQSVSGTDRPVYLEAMAGIMMRKEWRMPYRVHDSSAGSSKSSLESESSDFLVESIYHNVRNIFNQNLLSQMSFVVERMSMRHAPASLVSFCGKACAYAFYFCPGIADMLVRLWNTPSDVYRRILADPSVHKGLGGRSIAHDIAMAFPLPVRPLSFFSHTTAIRHLRQPPNLPLSAVQIQWHGPWVSRWCGRESDLFFVFIKHFHVLHCDFLSTKTQKSQRIFAPGMVSVQGQLLVVLEDTLYRQSSPQMPENAFATSSVTFDDLMEAPDTAMSTLPLGAANRHRSMAENRLIILLRDLFTDPSQESTQARRIYADSFMRTLKTAARRTSLFDHNACFVLCDFVEEAAPLINQYCRKIKEDIFDWPFWMDVCKQMARSQNSLTEVRLFAFVFSLWKTWTSDSQRHRDLCEQFLLNDNYFYHYFSHWSPMVRSYFHRLLCWRVARFNEDPSSVDSDIYELLLDKLEQVWAYYLSFQSRAAKERKAQLSSAPCSPAPSRRILIIRCDNQQPSPTNLFVSFDRVSTPQSTLSNGSYRSHGVLTVDPNGFPSESQSAPRRRWNMLKNMFAGVNNPKPGEVTPPGSSDENDINPMDNFMGDVITPTVSSSSQDSGSQPGDDSDSFQELQTPHQQYIFKFSLEWQQYTPPSKNRRLFSPTLPNGTLHHIQYIRSKTLHDSTTDDDSGAEGSIDELKGDQRDTDGSNASTNESYMSNKISVDETEAIDVSKLRNEHLVASKYAGRALAEWAIVVSECDNFYDRRRDEGVPTDDLVEIPTLSVDNFRK